MASPIAERIEKSFSTQGLFGDQPERILALQERAKSLAYAIAGMSPESREQSIALTKLQECLFWAGAAIACNEKEFTDERQTQPGQV